MLVDIFANHLLEPPMVTMIVISSAALLVAILGSAFIWGWDALRADQIEHATVRPVYRPEH